MRGLTAVISQDFCAPRQLHLTVTRKLVAVTDCNFDVTDEDGNIQFKVKQKLFSLHDRCVLLDAGGTTIATLRKKYLCARNQWQVFKGENSGSAKLLFTAKKPSVTQSKTMLDVFLSGNEDDTSWDFKVVDIGMGRSCISKIFHTNSHEILVIWKNGAVQMHKKYTIGSVVLGECNCLPGG